MSYKTLISADLLQRHLQDEKWVVIDCRFDLSNTAAGRQAYEIGHIPRAGYADLDKDLSSAPVTDHGRHPLPEPAAQVALFRRLGISNDSQVVVYDANIGVYASRLWWMLRYMGHEAVAVLDGGFTAWQAAGLPVSAAVAANEPGSFQGDRRTAWLVQMDEIVQAPLLVDSRGAARYRGEQEPLDSKAGHIPGARNYFYQENLMEDGLYRAPVDLRAQFEPILGETPVADTVFYCGSGVSACVNLLALAHAGLGDGRLYAGSWSDWISDPDNPVATG